MKRHSNFINATGVKLLEWNSEKIPLTAKDKKQMINLAYETLG